MLEARKKKGISQDELAKHLGAKGPAIGRYERDEMKPSIEAVAKMAELLDVSLDYRRTDILVDTKIMNRIIELQKLNTEE
jgi:transcriptional regulator with XRE-family HTH domain